MKIRYLVALNNHKEIVGFKKAAELLTVRTVKSKNLFIIIYTKHQCTVWTRLRVTFHNNSDSQLVLLYSHRADVPGSTQRPNILTIFYCGFPQRLHVAYRDIIWKLIKNIPFHILPNSFTILRYFQSDIDSNDTYKEINQMKTNCNGNTET